jgi:UDP-4-amino-4,6-dideoxy-N-acetyl-beta-L-altrosamine N-acetyltransferase
MLRPLKQEDSKKVLSWRNHPSVRVNMYTSHEISEDEHEQWVTKVMSDSSKRYFIFERDREPVGVVGFTDIDHINQTASWAFYSGRLDLRGIGVAMESAAIDFAFNELHLRKLNCEVIDFNQAVISLHRKFGFKVEGVFKNHYKRDEKLHDIYRLSLSREDWERLKHPVDFLCSEAIKVRTTKHFPVTFSLAEVEKFVSACADTNAFDLELSVARSAGSKSKIVPEAMLIARLYLHFASDFPGPGTIIVEHNAKFLQPLYPGKQLSLRLSVSQIIGNQLAISFDFSDEADRKLIVGECVVIAPVQN